MLTASPFGLMGDLVGASISSCIIRWSGSLMLSYLGGTGSSIPHSRASYYPTVKQLLGTPVLLVLLVK